MSTLKRNRHRAPLPWLHLRRMPKGTKGHINRRLTLKTATDAADWYLHSTKGWRRYSR